MNDCILLTTFSETPLETPANHFATRWAHITPWIYPVWMTGWDFALLLTAVVVAMAWTVVDLITSRDRLAKLRSPLTNQ